jgi:hypothetical protein
MKKLATSAPISAAKRTHIEQITPQKSRVETTKNSDFSALGGQNIGFGLQLFNVTYSDK